MPSTSSLKCFLAVFSCSLLSVVESLNVSYGGLSASSAPPIPSRIAPDQLYNVNLPVWPTTYSDVEISSQVQAGNTLVTTLGSVFQKHINGSNAGNGSYTVAPGVYRIPEQINIPEVENFKLIMSNVELLSTPANGFFQINNANNLEIAGPLHLDWYNMSESQGIIVGTDMKSYVDVKTMPGYGPPNNSSRIKCFNAQGIQQRHYQDTITSATDQGNDVWRVTLGNAPNSFTDYPEEAQTFKVGNYFTSQGTNTAGGVNFQGTGNLHWHDVYHYYSGLTFGQNIAGTLRLDNWRGQRRPGTNRLGSGGWLMLSFDGGSLDVTNSEISGNYGDLTDITGYMSDAMTGPSSNQLYLSATHMEVGCEFNFYDASNLVPIGAASIVDISTEAVGQDTLNSMSNMSKTADTHNVTGSPQAVSLVTMSGPIKGQSGLYLADDVKSRPKLISFRDSYLHDGLAAGFQIRGADKVVASGNVVARAAINCATAGFSAYWLEGGIPANIAFTNNYCLDSPYSFGMTAPAISVMVEPYQLSHAENNKVIKNVTIANNTIVNPQLGSIQVALSEGVVIENNAIYNAGAVIPNGQDIPYGISLQTVNDAAVNGNAFHNTEVIDAVSGWNLLVANNRTQLTDVKTADNSVTNHTSGSAVKVALGAAASLKIYDLDTSDY